MMRFRFKTKRCVDSQWLFDVLYQCGTLNGVDVVVRGGCVVNYMTHQIVELRFDQSDGMLTIDKHCGYKMQFPMYPRIDLKYKLRTLIRKLR